jgi:hypothetical protein
MKSKETTEIKSNEQTKLTLKGSQNLNSGAKTDLKLASAVFSL